MVGRGIRLWKRESEIIACGAVSEVWHRSDLWAFLLPVPKFEGIYVQNEECVSVFEHVKTAGLKLLFWKSVSCQTHLRILSLSDPHSPEHPTSNLGAAHSDPLMPDSLESLPLRAPVWADPYTSPWIPLQYKDYLWWQHKCNNSDP